MDKPINSPSEKDACATCSYNTNDYVCHPHCGGCNGTSRYKPRSPKFYKTVAVDPDGTFNVAELEAAIASVIQSEREGVTDNENCSDNP